MNVAGLWAMHVAGSKADGYCGELDDTGTLMCVELADHPGRHSWEGESWDDDEGDAQNTGSKPDANV